MSVNTTAERSESTEAAPAGGPALRPWQFFLLAGMLCATAAVVLATGQSAAAIIVLSLTIVSTSLVALGAYRALAPLVTESAARSSPLIVGRTRAALEREKTLVLRAIKELEFDAAMGKIAPGDFDEMSARLRARAIRLMRELDRGDGYQEAIEQELRARLARATPAAAAEPVAGDAAAFADDGDAEAPGSAGEAAANRCACGTTNDADARFCKECGTRLVA